MASNLPNVGLTGTVQLGGELRLASAGNDSQKDTKIVYGITSQSTGSSVLAEAHTPGTDQQTLTTAANTSGGPSTFKLSYLASSQFLRLTMGPAQWLSSQNTQEYNTGPASELYQVHDLSFQTEVGVDTFVDWQIDNPENAEFELVLFGNSTDTTVAGNSAAFWFVYADGQKGPYEPPLTAVGDRFYRLNSISEAIELDVIQNDKILPPGIHDDIVIAGISSNQGGDKVEHTQADRGGGIGLLNNNITYLPLPGFSGNESFYYEITENNGNTSEGQVVVYVGVPISLEDFIYALIEAIERWMRTTAEGSRLLDLYHEHEEEIIEILLNHPEIAGELINQAASSFNENLIIPLNPGGVSTRDYLIGDGGELLALYDLWQPGLSSLLAGQGEGAVISQGMVDQLKTFRDAIYQYAGTNLQSVIDTESMRWNGLQDFVGMNFNQFSLELGVDPEKLAIWTYDFASGNNQFSMILTETEGIDFTLFKAETLNPLNWTEVTETLKSTANGKVTLTDPNPGTTKAFYQVRANLEESGQN